jgi:methylase of polypeptide subunit release factors
MEVGMGFWPSKVLLSAIELGLFTTLGERSMTARELQNALGLHQRANPDFFDTLVALRFLHRDGTGPAATYRNTDETALFLDRTSPQFIGGFLEMSNARLYHFWGDLTEALRTGKPQNEIKHTGASMFAELYREPKRLEQFMDAMAGISAANFQALADQFDFSRYHTLCDVGGATGLLSMLVARRHPHIQCTSTDLPAATAIAHRKIAEQGLSDRVSASAVDFLAEPLPKADVITMGMILHDWNLDQKM